MCSERATCGAATTTCAVIPREIFYEGPTATLLQSYTAALGDQSVELAWRLFEVDEGISFVVSRSADGGAFSELDASEVRREGLGFAYTDSSVEPEKKYTYQVDYALGGERKLLFVSEPVERPPRSLPSIRTGRTRSTPQRRLRSTCRTRSW